MRKSNLFVLANVVFIVAACSGQDSKYDKEALELAKSYLASKWLQCGDRLVQDQGYGNFLEIKNYEIRITRYREDTYSVKLELYSDNEAMINANMPPEMNKWAKSPEPMPLYDSDNGSVWVKYEDGRLLVFGRPVPVGGFGKPKFTCAEVP